MKLLIYNLTDEVTSVCRTTTANQYDVLCFKLLGQQLANGQLYQLFSRIPTQQWTKPLKTKTDFSIKVLSVPCADDVLLHLNNPVQCIPRFVNL